MTEDVMKTEGHTPTPWYVGSQNDMLYIVDKPPRPAPADYPYDIPDLTVVSKMMGPDFSTERDNANFIVTAVNERSALLKCEEALRAAMRVLSRENPWEHAYLDDYNAAYADARAALTLLDEARK